MPMMRTPSISLAKAGENAGSGRHAEVDDHDCVIFLWIGKFEDSLANVFEKLAVTKVSELNGTYRPCGGRVKMRGKSQA